VSQVVSFSHSLKNKKEFNKYTFYPNKDYIADAKRLAPMIKQAGGMQARRNVFFEKSLDAMRGKLGQPPSRQWSFIEMSNPY